jgi:hypothetical protein
VAVAQNVIKVFLDRDRTLVMQHYGFRGLARTVAERRLRVGEDEHLANPETKLSGAGTVLGAILQDSVDLIKEALRDERLGLLALREGREIFVLDALVLFVRGEPGNITRAVGNVGATLTGSLEPRSLNMERVIGRIGGGGHSNIARVQIQSTENTFQTGSRVRFSIVRGHRRRQAADRPIVGYICHSLNWKRTT